MQRTRLVVAGVAVLLVLVLLVLLLRPGGGGGGSAEVVLREGPAFACAHNQACTTPAVLGAQVFVDGEARTGAVGLQDLQTATATFRLQEGATLQFAAVTDAVTQITLSAGRLFVNHDAAGRDQIVIQAGTTRVAALHTRFCVIASGGQADVAVPQPTGGKGRTPGSVRITLAGSAPVALTAGQEVVLVPGRRPNPRPISAAEQARWNQLVNWP
jgi:ferric-dicitrate binding protein FerR (iron transport regulator)